MYFGLICGAWTMATTFTFERFQATFFHQCFTALANLGVQWTCGHVPFICNYLLKLSSNFNFICCEMVVKAHY